MICKKCGTVLPDGSLFCGECGAKVEVMGSVRTVSSCCGQCGAEIVPGSAFCGECGAPVSLEFTPKKGDTVVDTPIELKCVICGTINEPGSAFCGGCGNKLGDHSLSRDEDDENDTEIITSNTDVPLAEIEEIPPASTVKKVIKTTLRTTDSKPEVKDPEIEKFFSKPNEL